jgi:hypothetical protein
MSKESGNWLPYELNSDKKHDCRTANQVDTKANDTIAKTEFTQSDVNMLEHVLAKMKLMVKESEK